MEKVFGKIILVDDHIYEKQLLESALKEKNWDLKVDHYLNAEDALEHLKTYKQEEIFLIISDLEMPGMNGLDFKKAIDNDKVLRAKAIPFIFASSISTKEQVAEAFNYRIQGYFKKPMNIEEQADMLDIIIKYWVIGRHPNLNRD